MATTIVAVASVVAVHGFWSSIDGIAAARLVRRVRADLPGDAAARRRVPRIVEPWIHGLGIEDDLVTVWRAWLATTALCVLLVPTTPLAALTLTGLVVGPCVARPITRHRRSALRRQQLGPSLENIAAGLRAGRSLRQCLELVEVGEPLSSELRGLGRAASRGQPLQAVLTDWAGTADDVDIHLTGAALAMADAVGGPAARALDATAGHLRERRELTAEASALASQARMSAAVLTAAPVAFFVATSASDDRTSAFLFGSPFGWLCLLLGVALDGIGCWWMIRLTRTVAGDPSAPAATTPPVRRSTASGVTR